MNSTIAIPVTETSQVGDVRRTVATLSCRLGFDDTSKGRIALLATELSNNLVQHATGGEILLSPLVQGDRSGIEVLALDRGPGIPDVARCLRDGYSTAGTPGNGLGAVMRMADAFDIFSVVDIGTAVMVRLWSCAGGVSGKAEDHPALDVGALCLPMAGEDVSGDACTYVVESDRSLFLLADGLGHGPDAAKASMAAMRVLKGALSKNPSLLLEEAHELLHGTRGAAAAVAAIEVGEGTVRFAGIGNIAAAVLLPDGTSRSMISHSGIVGHRVHKFQEFTYPWPKNGILLMHSDGLATRWSLDQYPTLLSRHPSLLAGILYRDFHRGQDDVTVLVARSHGAQKREWIA